MAEQAVVATYRKMEDADRRGDGELWLALRDRATLGAMKQAVRDTIRKGGRSRPSVRYEPLLTRAIGTRSVLVGKVEDPDSNTVQYDAILFVLEDGEWKVSREQWSEKPIDPFVAYAMLEPVAGEFMRGGTPWKTIPYASSNPDVVQKADVVWKVQGTFDESFLYVRFESVQALPLAGSKLRPNLAKIGATGGPPSPPNMVIKSSTLGLYEISVSSLVSMAPAVDAKGKAAGERYSVGYKLSVKKGDGDEVFTANIGEDSRSFLLAVSDRAIDVRIPVDALGGESRVRPATVDLEDADPISRVLPYHVPPYHKQ
jgi:hypothetical protein